MRVHEGIVVLICLASAQACSGNGGDGGNGGNGGDGGDIPDLDGTPADSSVVDGAATDAAAARYLCVFDYDLTLSSHACSATDGRPDMHCRTTECTTYDWRDQCLGQNAREAIAECVRRNAYIGIASHANADACWDDKVAPIVTEMQFPEWTGSSRYGGEPGDLWYPAIDDRANWNCESCAYTLDPAVDKPEAIRRIMRHYDMAPTSASEQRAVIFWDDSPSNIEAVQSELPGVTTVLVPRHGSAGSDGGCGITQAQIDEAWNGVAF